MEIREECVCSLPQLEATKMKKKILLSVGLLSWIVFCHSNTLPLLAFSQGKSMRIRMHFHNLHSENQDVSASSQQLHESCFLVRLARKQQFISWGTWGLKTRPSEHKKGILTKSKPRGTTHRQPPSREMAADGPPAFAELARAHGSATRMPWAVGKLHTPRTALLLAYSSSPSLSPQPWKKSPATARMPLASYQHVPSQCCHSSPFPSRHLQAVPHNSLDPPQHSISSWPLLGQSLGLGPQSLLQGGGHLREAGQGQSQMWCPQRPWSSHHGDDAV